MRLAQLFVGLTVAATCVVAQSAAAQEAGLPKPIWFGQLAFSIPFNLQPSLSPEQQPTQIQLYVSTDRGATWRLAQAVSPQTKNFDFRAPTEGAYGFLIRTVDRQGRVAPDAAGPPELLVVVDTTPPKLELSAVRGQSGEVRANWKATDPLLNPDSLKIEYQVSAGSWRAVAIDPQRITRDENSSTGTVDLWPNEAPPPPNAVVIRAEIRDRAGNPTRVQAKTQAAPSEQFAPQPSDDLTTGNHRNPWPDAATRWPAEQSSAGPLDRSLATNSAASNRGHAEDRPPYLARTPEWTRPRDFQNDSYRQPPDDANLDRAMVSPINPPIRNQMPIADESREPRRTNRRTNDDDRPSNDNDRPTLDDSPALPRSQDSFDLPSGERPRMVNSKSFEMDYEIESIGPSGIAKVELWGTRDGGRTWTSYGVDNDNRAPMRVNVEGEGLYGFRITVQSGSGLSSPTPRSGDQPEVWIAVDLAKPKVLLTDVQTGVGQHAGELLIRWEATDAALAVRPVTLLFADKPGGPWSIIAANLENTGQYAWRPDNRAPDSVYLRIEARDEAGNTGIYESADPVPLDRVRPEGRIRGVRPVTDSASRTQLYQFYR